MGLEPDGNHLKCVVVGASFPNVNYQLPTGNQRNKGISAHKRLATKRLWKLLKSISHAHGTTERNHAAANSVLTPAADQIPLILIPSEATHRSLHDKSQFNKAPCHFNLYYTGSPDPKTNKSRPCPHADTSDMFTINVMIPKTS